MRRLMVLVTWGIATLVALAAAWQTRSGPVLVRLSEQHGVHLGDLLAFAIAYSWAVVVTLALPPDRGR